MELFYNGHTYTYTATPPRFIRPRAINWRHQVPGEVTESLTSTPLPRTLLNPQAVNWRYQIPGMA
ncbi:MAG: hypothetical protein WCA35_06745 [Kovacikia sp.]